MNATRFRDERRQEWDGLDALVRRANGRLTRLSPAEVYELGHRYRAAAADLAVARRQFPSDPVTARLDTLVREARMVVYSAPHRSESFGHWATTGFWRRVRERPVVLLVAALLLWGSALLTGVWAHANPEQATRVASITPLSAGAAQPPSSADRGFSSGRSADLSSQIFTNNARAALLAFAGGLTGGLLTAFVALFNGFLIGLIGGITLANGAGEVFFRLVLPHGVLEFSLLTVAAAAGLRVGWALVHPGHRRRGQALLAEARAGGEMALGCALLLVPTGLVEGFVTPKGLPLGAALAVGFGLAGAFWALVLWRGRPATPAPAP